MAQAPIRVASPQSVPHPPHSIHIHFTRSLSICTSRHVCIYTLLHPHPHPLLVKEDSILDMEISGTPSHFSLCATRPASQPWNRSREASLQRGCCRRGPLSEALSGLDRRRGNPCLKPRTLTWSGSGSLQAGPLLKGIFGLGFAWARIGCHGWGQGDSGGTSPAGAKLSHIQPLPPPRPQRE